MRSHEPFEKRKKERERTRFSYLVKLVPSTHVRNTIITRLAIHSFIHVITMRSSHEDELEFSQTSQEQVKFILPLSMLHDHYVMRGMSSAVWRIHYKPFCAQKAIRRFLRRCICRYYTCSCGTYTQYMACLFCLIRILV